MTPERLALKRLYPLQIPLAVVGLGLGIVVGALLDWVAGLSVFSLFALVGFSWRADMPPLFPACIAYQWIFASSGYLWRSFGGFAGNAIETSDLAFTLLISLAGLAALAAGLRLVLRIYAPLLLSITGQPPTKYWLVRVFWLTIAAFAVNYVIYLVPSQIWFGGAQIIQTILLLRFVPYFLLVVTVFERGRGYPYLLVATVWVIAPEFLTGFSSFREVLLVVIIGALAQWRPWIPTKAQARRNRQVIVFGVVGASLVVALGLIWSGGMKQQWREQIWKNDVGVVSPLKRMGDFVSTFGHVSATLDYAEAANSYAERVSSSSYFFAMTGQRVPQTLKHEHGTLLMMAINNAITPRFLFADKAVLDSDSWLVRKYAGVNVAGAESDTSVALGYMAEYYIDFGVAGVVILSFLWGSLGGLAVAALAKCAPSRELLLAVLIGLFIQSFMGFETSFIKLLGGTIMRTVLTCLVMLLVGPTFNKWLQEGLNGPPGTAPRQGKIRPAPRQFPRPGQARVR